MFCRVCVVRPRPRSARLVMSSRGHSACLPSAWGILGVRPLCVSAAWGSVLCVLLVPPPLCGGASPLLSLRCSLRFLCVSGLCASVPLCVSAAWGSVLCVLLVPPLVCVVVALFGAPPRPGQHDCNMSYRCLRKKRPSHKIIKVFENSEILKIYGV